MLPQNAGKVNPDKESSSKPAGFLLLFAKNCKHCLMCRKMPTLFV